MKSIVTVTLNAAVDTTLVVEGGLRLGASQTAARVLRLPGGKGLNVARVLRVLGAPVLATGLWGGPPAAFLSAGLREAGIEADFVTVAGASRTNVAIVDNSVPGVMEINEPGPAVSAAEGQAFLTRYDALLPRARAVVLAGSLPPGLPDEYYALLIERARLAGVPALLDTSGRGLGPALSARPALVAPNHVEAAAVANRPVASVDDAVVVARILRARGAALAAITLGVRGAVLVTDGTAWHARPPEVDVVSAVGSGDAFLAGMAATLCGGVDTLYERARDAATIREALTLAVACGAANTERLGAGIVTAEAIARIKARVDLREVTLACDPC